MRKQTPFVLFWLALCLCGPAAAVEPGVERSMELQQRLSQAYIDKGIGYRPRTEHFNEDGSPRYINRLILEDSPYLLQHAHNPVDWHPWSDEAFARAKAEDKPIFLSIGYSTCHWCHVMERESFESPAIAALINEHFIPIKVDRESHPDVDEVYMTAVMLISGHGGWPMSSFLTPDGKPFFGGTYYPPTPFTGLLKQVTQVWTEQRKQVEEQASRIAAAVAENNRLKEGSKAFDPVIAQRATSALGKLFDEIQGGFGQAPKFPHEPWLFLLLDQSERHNDLKTLEMLTTTLDHMSQGGIYDQVAGGFHRYSTDYEWLVPHFEKMLYNQAHLSRLYLGAWRQTGHERYRRVVIQTLDYVLREMTTPKGGFYSATDADSEGEEGLFFTWTLAELRDALSSEDAELAKSIYSVSRIGNFEGRNIFHLQQSLETYAQQHQLEIDELRQRLDQINQQLLDVRNQRVAPLRDDKMVTAWNGMMITAFAEAAALLGSDQYRQAARSAAEFLWQHNRQSEGRLWRVHLDGRSSIAAAQEDYAFFAEGLIALYDLTGEPLWLERAQELADALLERFRDPDGGGFFMNEAEAGLTVMGRPRDDGSDTAIPSGSSVAMQVLQKLWRRTGNLHYRQQAQELIARFTPSLEELPHNYAYMLTAILDQTSGELSPLGYAAQGGIRLQATLAESGKGANALRVDLQIPDGWHINSDQPGHPDLIGTRVWLDKQSGWNLEEIRYPQGQATKLGFQSNPISLYSGQVSIEARLDAMSETPTALTLPLTIRLQACNDQVCLPPEEITLRVTLP
jgi:uncharacterized protein YyaL (SSP411 family)